MKRLFAASFFLFSTSLLALTPEGLRIHESHLWNLPVPEKLTFTMKPQYNLDTTCKFLESRANVLRKYKNESNLNAYNRIRLSPNYEGMNKVFGVFSGLTNAEYGRVDFIFEDQTLNGQDDLLLKKISKSNISLAVRELSEEKLNISYDKNSLTELSISYGLNVPLPQIEFNGWTKEIILTTSSMDTACDLLFGRMKIDVTVTTSLSPRDEQIQEVRSFYQDKVIGEIKKINKKLKKTNVRAAHFGRHAGMIIERDYPHYTKKEVKSILTNIIDIFLTEEMNIKPSFEDGIFPLWELEDIKTPLEITVKAK